MTDESSLRERFIETVESQVGYKSLPGVPTPYGSKARYPNAAEWSGTFLDWAAHQTGLFLPALTDTTYARQRFDTENRMRRKPRRGDFTWVPGEAFQQWKMGLVTRVDSDANGYRCETVFGNIVNPAPRATSDRPGVFATVIHQTDGAYVFARPRYRLYPDEWVVPGKDSDTVVRLSDLTSNRQNTKIRAVQESLTRTGRYTEPTGKWDRMTRQQFADFQRFLGWVGEDANGAPQMDSLYGLQHWSGGFAMKE